MSLSKHKNLKLVAAIVLSVLAISYVRSTNRANQSDAMAVAQCLRLYSEATTAAESALVDVVHPIQAVSEEMTCLSLQNEGRLEPHR